MKEVLFDHARLVLPDRILQGHLCLRDGRIHDAGAGSLQCRHVIDCGNDYLFPGLVELHTDNLEKHLLPRPGVIWPARAAWQAHDAQLLAAGITTACDALTVGDVEAGSLRIATLAQAYRELTWLRENAQLRIHHQLHLRAELPCPDLPALLAPLLGDPSLRLLSLMDHTPGQRQYRDLQLYAGFYGLDLHQDMHAVLEQRRQQQARHRGENLRQVLAMVAARGIALASHDDTEPEDVSEALGYGATISEFPTTLAAAQAARAAGMHIVAGAPNLVRGGSHSGNVGALALARHDCLDIISSDYVPGSLLHAIAVLRQEAGWPLWRAVAAASAAPARALGMDDCGALLPGHRGDLLRVRGDDAPRLMEVWVQGRCKLAG